MKKRIEDLIGRGVVLVAQHAAENPTSLGGLTSFALGIAAKDYPAMTPRLWNGTYQQLGLPRRNVRLIAEAASFAEVAEVLRTDPRYVGGDVGAGIKDSAWQYLDELDPLAEAMRAINVVVKRDGKLVGYNTDGLGYVAGLRRVLEPPGKKILILGGGGTANAIAFAAAQAGMRVVVLNRTVSKADELVARVNEYIKREVAQGGGRDQIAAHAPHADVIVSVIDDPHSPLDQYSALGEITLPATADALAVNAKSARAVMQGLKGGVLISDVALRQQETATLRLAREAGLQTQDGRPMVLEQGIEAFWLVNRPLLSKHGITKEQVSEVMRAVAAH